MSYNYITHPVSGEQLSIFSNSGRELLKSYLRIYKSGGSNCNNISSECRYENDKQIKAALAKEKAEVQKKSIVSKIIDGFDWLKQPPYQ